MHRREQQGAATCSAVIRSVQCDLARDGTVGVRLTEAEQSSGPCASCTVAPPYVEVVVPANYGHYLPGCTDSIVNQPEHDADHGSSTIRRQMTPRRSLSALSSYRQVRLIRNETNSAKPAIFNVAYVRQTADYAVFVSRRPSTRCARRATALMENRPWTGQPGLRPRPEVRLQPAACWPMPTISWTTCGGIGGSACTIARKATSPPRRKVVRTRVHHEVGYRVVQASRTAADVEMHCRQPSDVGHVIVLTKRTAGANRSATQHDSACTRTSTNAGVPTTVPNQLVRFTALQNTAQSFDVDSQDRRCSCSYNSWTTTTWTPRPRRC